MKKIVIAAAALAAVSFMGCQKKTSSGDVKLELYYYKQENQEGLKFRTTEMHR